MPPHFPVLLPRRLDLQASGRPLGRGQQRCIGGRSCALGWQPTVVAQVPEHLQVVSLEPGGGLDETWLWAETPLLSSPGRHPWELRPCLAPSPPAPSGMSP